MAHAALVCPELNIIHSWELVFAHLVLMSILKEFVSQELFLFLHAIMVNIWVQAINASIVLQDALAALQQQLAHNALTPVLCFSTVHAKLEDVEMESLRASKLVMITTT